MKDILGLGLLAVGGWALYEWLMGSANTAQASSTGSTGSGATTTANTTQNQTNTNVQHDNAGSAGSSVTALPAGFLILSNISPDINNSLKALASFQMQTLDPSKPLTPTVITQTITDSLNVIPATGQIFNSVGQDVTNSFGSSAAQIVAAYISRAKSQGISVAGMNGLGRLYTSGWDGMGPGLGRIGAGYGINDLRLAPDASSYELAIKREF